jgi:hypothetical protein
MSRIMIVVLIYHRHKPIDPTVNSYTDRIDLNSLDTFHTTDDRESFQTSTSSKAEGTEYCNVKDPIKSQSKCRNRVCNNCFVFGKSPVQMSVQKPSILPDIVQIRSRLLPSPSFPIHCPLIILSTDAVSSELIKRLGPSRCMLFQFQGCNKVSAVKC